MPLSRRLLLGASLAALAAPALARGAAAAADPPRPGSSAQRLPEPGRRGSGVPVCATFSILADMVRQIGGEGVDVHAIVAPGTDAHSFQPRPGTQRWIATTHLVVRNGLGFEGWIERLIRTVGYRGRIVTATDGITPLRIRAGRSHSHGHGVARKHDGPAARNEPDPHAWQDLGLARHYVRNILAGLVEAAPAGEAQWRAGAERFLAEIAATDAWVREQVARVPAEKRRVITSHDAFAYFGAAYGVEFLAPQGVSTEGGVSAAGVARLIRQIREQRIKAVFIEDIADRRIMERIAHETGVELGGMLCSDSLAPEGLPSTYLGMFRYNVPKLVAGMLKN